MTKPVEAEDRGPIMWGYARVSTPEQSVAAQVTALVAAGVDPAHVVTEVASGARARRPKLEELLHAMQRGDTLVVWKLDRLGRSMGHLVTTIDDLGQRGIEFRSVTDAIDTRTAQGRVMFGILAAFAAFERDLIRERTSAGLARARDEGKQLGRPTRVSGEQYRLIHRLRAEGATYGAIAASCGLTTSVVGRVLRGELPQLDARYGSDGNADLLS